MIFAEAACRTVFPMHSVMMRRECVDVVGFFDEGLKLQPDLDYWGRFAAVYPFEAIDEPVAYYRVHDQMSILTQSDELIRVGILVQSRLFEMPAFAALSPSQKARAFSIHGTQYFMLGENRAARSWYVRAIRTAPTYIRPYLLLALKLVGRGSFDALSRFYRRLRGETT